MSTFFNKLDQYVGTGFDRGDIRAVVRRCYFFDFDGYPVRIWQGHGRLHTEDGNVWLGTQDGAGNDLLQPPRITDGRDGTSPTYEFALSLVDLPGQPARQTYDALKADQALVRDRPLTIYYALFEVGEGLRPTTPIEFFKELTMQATRFEERPELNGTSLLLRYRATVIAKDGNSGRSSVPGGTYNPSVQRARARQLGLTFDDKGCDFVAGLADRTYQLP